MNFSFEKDKNRFEKNRFENYKNNNNNYSYTNSLVEVNSKTNNVNNKLVIRKDIDEYYNRIYYPASSREWFSHIYSYNKSYTKTLVVLDGIIKNLFSSYFNMLQNKLIRLYKRRRHYKKRYSANRIFVSRAEVKHTNTKIFVILYTYNKQKFYIERHIRNIIKLIKVYAVVLEKKKEFIVRERNSIVSYIKKNLVYKKLYFENKKGIREYTKILSFTDRLVYLFRDKLDGYNKFNRTFFILKKNLLNYFSYKIKGIRIRTAIGYDRKIIRITALRTLLLNYTKAFNFNISKFNNLVLNLRNLGLIKLIEKLYSKKVEIKLVELKSLYLNSDVFTAAVALKLRNRHNKAIRVLRKAVLHMVKIPALHTLITNEANYPTRTNENILETLEQQVVSGVRFEAAGRLTKRLTAMRSIFKYRYEGNLKDIRSSYNAKSTAMVRGYAKPNAQKTIVNSKTRNGAFGLKGWVSSH